MDDKTLVTLEFAKVLERLSSYAAFSASAELTRELRPVSKLEDVLLLLKITSEARLLLSTNTDISVGAAHDIRPLVDRAGRHGVLDAHELLEVKETLIAARGLARYFEKAASQFPNLGQIALAFPPPNGVVDAISRAISDRGEILDQASEKLARIRHDVKIAHERLMSRLEHMVNDAKVSPMLQESLVTQRNGRYVIPLRAEFKGQVRSIIHDQSSSGATLFVEPLVVVDLNNEWQSQQLAEKEEERRILAELSDLVGDSAELIHRLVDSLARFDCALACAKYADDLHAHEPEMLKYRVRAQQDHTNNHPGCTIRLFQARHPLLDPAIVVPLDIDLDERTFGVVITGPNTGGKTVTLKTVGLMVLMAQSGLHIPTASGSQLSLFENVFADIGDEQSIEQSLSTFSGHIKNIVRVLRRANPHTLVLFDELGAGTDPQEGAALARAILAELVEQRVPHMVATHYPELKIYAHNTPGITNASMEFDPQTLRPTYRLTIGLPGRSNALAIASRLGLDKKIIEDARSEINPDELRADSLLNEIHRQREQTRRIRQQSEDTQKELDRAKIELVARLERIEDERRDVLEKARAQAETEVDELRSEMEDVRRALLRARQPLEALRSVQHQVEDLVVIAQQTVVRHPTVEVTSHPLRPGEKVRVRSIRMEGVITAISESDVEVQVGNLRVRARLGDIQRKGEPDVVRPEPAPAAGGRTTVLGVGGKPGSGKAAADSQVSIFSPSPGMEIDLRGQRAEDALDALGHYIESAYLSGLPFVRVIHGKGTGRLRQVIREALNASPHIKNFGPGLDAEGGDGVTVAHLNAD